MSTTQKSLFGAEVAWEVDDTATGRVASVVFAVGVAQEFDYLVPDPLVPLLAAGQRVRVPLGASNRLREAYCVRVEDRALTGRRLKSVAAVVDRKPLLTAPMLRLTEWMAEHYLCPWGQVFEAVVPSGVRGGAGTRETLFFYLADDALKRADEEKLPEKQQRVLTYLATSDEGLTLAQLMSGAHCTAAPVQGLVKKRFLVKRARRVLASQVSFPVMGPEPALVLNPDQDAALRTIQRAMESQRHSTLLLYGVTGSGKTEVYIRSIEEVVGYGRQAIVLVPEISLTPQTVARFRTRFKSVAVLHSHMTDAERHSHWLEIASGRVQVVVGARSAVFAPTPHLGLIVIDEEHEASFKQDSAPRYHARDVALVRASDEGVPLVLGSATPSLESWRRAQAGEYQLLRLPRRVHNRPLPSVSVIDLRLEASRKVGSGALSRSLVLAMKQALADGGQVILLLNRRGYSTHIQCPACGEVVRCPHCDLSLVHHRHEHKAHCHRCDYRADAPQACPKCKFAGIRYSGMGTQRLEAEVKARFPDDSCLRMDTDSMQSRGSHERALSSFRAGDVRILLGTQMIAKGLDFPNVTLVGVVNADTALHLPDFRAGERSFQLLAQVAGRTGRGNKGGTVVVQTLSPDHPAIVAATRHDFEAFAAQELPVRELLGYPPFGELVRLIVRGPVAETAQAACEHLAERLRPHVAAVEGSRMLGPAPAPIARLRNDYRFQIQLQAAECGPLLAAIRAATSGWTPPEGVQWAADVDPVLML